MKRSRINAIIQETDTFLRERMFHLPPFAYWTPADWEQKGPEAGEIVEAHLGWDITDFGQGDFDKVGLFVFTIRNGMPDGAKSYAEKILVVNVDQVTPLHFHWSKMEDIINRGGGDLAVKVYNATKDEALAETDVTVSLDGLRRTVPPGQVLLLRPGESITLAPYCYHEFWGVGERVLVGEVSRVNDDATDNRFLDPIGRFPDIEEDEAPLHLLVNDYERYFRG